MRSRSPLVLMELVVMVLVFALAAALCLQVFAFSHHMTRKNQDTDNAVLLAQNTAELLKAAGDIDTAMEQLGGELRQGIWRVEYHEDLTRAASGEDACYRVDTACEAGAVDGLAQARIEVFSREEGQPLFSLTVAWQEVDIRG